MNKEHKNLPLVKAGVSILLLKKNLLLLGLRKGSHGSGTWAPPGGHIEYMESIQSCASRELLEETDLKVSNFFQGPYTNDFFFSENKHYVTLFVIAKYESGEPRLLEPEKCQCWKWFDWENLPSPLFLPLQNLLSDSTNLEFIQKQLSS